MKDIRLEEIKEFDRIRNLFKNKSKKIGLIDNTNMDSHYKKVKKALEKISDKDKKILINKKDIHELVPTLDLNFEDKVFILYNPNQYDICIDFEHRLIENFRLYKIKNFEIEEYIFLKKYIFTVENFYEEVQITKSVFPNKINEKIYEVKNNLLCWYIVNRNRFKPQI